MRWRVVPHTQAIAVTSVMMFIGAVVAGPRGLAIGAPSGDSSGPGCRGGGEFKSVPQMLKELTPTEKENLRSQVSDIVRDLKGRTSRN
ncbi:hypothetical protein QTO34_005433 [Cnephaeus nilssonii]|uniref:Uncharacterized protein n=1 Tax=Cnephaeus nilssonii TaxID=3371016 RepID=A0AA40HNE9_CNENI|nr:hypothetical protein QTO34_005433 [Eptesicus nilssonii]